MAVRVPKEVILSYFYPETSVVSVVVKLFCNICG